MMADFLFLFCLLGLDKDNMLILFSDISLNYVGTQSSMSYAYVFKHSDCFKKRHLFLTHFIYLVKVAFLRL